MTKDYTFGPEYEVERDSGRIANQMEAILNLMKDGEWRTLSQIEAITGYPPASISAQLRHLRKKRFGSYVVTKEYIENGLYKYKLSAPEKKEDAKKCLVEEKLRQPEFSI